MKIRLLSLLQFWIKVLINKVLINYTLAGDQSLCWMKLGKRKCGDASEIASRVEECDM